MNRFLCGVYLSLSFAIGLLPAATVDCVVATVHPLATDAATKTFNQGGNAVDAAISAALTLGVVDTHNSGIGGGCFVLIRRPDGGIICIDGREMAPAAATADMYLQDGKAVPDLSQTGPLAVAVPGAVAAYQLAVQQAGNRTLAELLEPAADLADRGFKIDTTYARILNAKAGELAQFEGSRAVLFQRDGTPYQQGDWLKQPDLANTYRQIATQGIGWFYRGDFANQVSDWMATNGGILTADDFANYQAVQRQPIVTSYRDWQIVGFPPPSSGGVHVAQILNILETFELPSIHEQDPAAAAHLIIEAMKLAFADRAHWLGDADFADVPLGLIGKPYAAQLAGLIDPDRSTSVANHGDPTKFEAKLFPRHTTHIAAADSDGYWVAITATINTSYGSKIIVPGTGVMLNNEMDDFSAQVGVPNAFGLVGAANNAIAPGKRPLSSMSPTIVLDQNGNPILTVGAAGGPKIITQVLLTIIRHLDFRQPLAKAVAAPRFHHQWKPDLVRLENTTDQRMAKRLQAMGHRLERSSSVGITQAISQDPSGDFVAVHDPRVSGKVGFARREK